MQVFAGKRVVEVDGDLIIRDLANLRLHDLTVHGVHRYDGTYIDAFVVKLTVSVEKHLLRQF